MRSTIPFWILPLNLFLAIIVLLLAIKTWLLPSELPERQLLAMRLVYHQIETEHVGPPSPEDLMWGAIEGMVGQLDEHSEFIRPSKVSQFERDTTGTYAGIGTLMVRGVMPVTVEYPFPGGPAERAGLRVGDRILAVDGLPIGGKTPAEQLLAAEDALLGPPGTEVKLTLGRGDDEQLETVVVRGEVQTSSVKWTRVLDAERAIGYVHIASFHPDTAREFTAALQVLDRLTGGRLAGLVLDLRYNRGGLLDEAIDISNAFLRKGNIVSLKKRGTQVVERHDAVPAKCLLPDLPVVLLVNGTSASASEVVAGCLQDHHRAELVGTHTFGKGVVQSIYRWKNLDFVLKLTTAHYYTPNGRSIESHNRRPEDGESGGGLEPEYVLPLGRDRYRALRVLLQSEEVPRAYRAQVRVLAERLHLQLPQPPGPDADPQLAKALALLRGSIDAGGKTGAGGKPR